MPGQHLEESEIRIIRRLRYVFGYTIHQTADMVGRGEGVVARVAPGHVGKIANQPLREAFLVSGKTAGDVARSLGWGYDRSHHGWNADSARVKRVLGILPDTSRVRNGNGERKRYRRETIDADMAVRIANVIGVTPDEVGARTVSEEFAEW